MIYGFYKVEIMDAKKFKKSFYNRIVNTRVIEFIGYPIFNIVVPPLVAIYYIVLDVWGEDWGIISNYKELHQFIFLLLISLTAIILFFKGVSEQFKQSVLNKNRELLELSSMFFNQLVKIKKDRFHEIAKNIKPTADIFNKITNPKKQINYAIDASKSLISSVFDVDEKNICITIIQGDPDIDKWWYEFQCDKQVQNTKAKVIMNSNSVASHCLSNGQSSFIVDIKESKNDIFYESDRSKSVEYGSIYCKPVRVKVNSKKYVYIFSIVIYGDMLCAPYDDEECKYSKKLLDDISSRIELELYLYSMKDFRVYKNK